MKTNKIIGEKIRSLRKMKNLSVEELAERTGLSAKQIESIEGNEELPSLAPLIKIARSLSVRLGTFLDDQQELGPVVFRSKNLDERAGIQFSNNAKAAHRGLTYYSLSQDKSGRHMEPFLVDIEPADQNEFIFSSHEGEEFIFVLEGSVEISYGKDVYTLAAGDSIYYDSIVAHHVHAGNDQSARILGIIYTPY